MWEHYPFLVILILLIIIIGVYSFDKYHSNKKQQISDDFNLVTIEYSENNQWNPINIFKTFLDKINSSVIKYEKDYISINFFLEELNRKYIFYLDKNYNIFKLRMKTNESKSSTIILINEIFFTNKVYNIGFDRSAYKDYFLNNL